MSELSCADVVELMTAYLEGALDPVTERRFADHLAGCEGCHRYLEQLRETVRLTGRLSPASISGQGREDLLNAFRDWPREPGEPDTEGR